MNINSFAMDGVMQSRGLHVAVLLSSSGRTAWMNRPRNEMSPWRHISANGPTGSLTLLLQAHEETHLSLQGLLSLWSVLQQVQTSYYPVQAHDVETWILVSRCPPPWGFIEQGFIEPYHVSARAKVLLNVLYCLTFKTSWELYFFPPLWLIRKLRFKEVP